MSDDGTRLRKALANCGVDADDVYDLVNGKVRYSTAIPVLVRLLEDGITDQATREGVIRALAVKEARGYAGPALIREFHRTPKEAELLRWTIGNAMEVIMTDDCTGAVIQIVRDTNNGMARQMFVLALGNVKNEEAEQALMSLFEDAEVAPQAIRALGKMKSRRAKQAIRKLLRHSRPLIRQEAMKALKRIE